MHPARDLGGLTSGDWWMALSALMFAAYISIIAAAERGPAVRAAVVAGNGVSHRVAVVARFPVNLLVACGST